MRPFAALLSEMSKKANHLYCFSKPFGNYDNYVMNKTKLSNPCIPCHQLKYNKDSADIKDEAS
jgi:hypothetical protein